MIIQSGVIYLTDNGASYCGAHLGHAARTTGRDLSGQRIQPVTPELAQQARAEGWEVTCEKCGKAASTLYLPTEG